MTQKSLYEFSIRATWVGCDHGGNNEAKEPDKKSARGKERVVDVEAAAES